MSLAPAPDWVEVVNVPAVRPRPAHERVDGIEYVVLDRQDNAVDGMASYRDEAWLVRGPVAVQYGSTIEIDFDPAAQRVELHAIEVRRGDDVFDRLVPERVRVVEREEELDDGLVLGTKTVLVIVEDVRPGDVVRNRYTVHGQNEAYGEHYVEFVEMQREVPVRWFRHRVLLPKELRLEIRRWGGAPAPKVTDLGAVRRYEWRAYRVPPFDLEEWTPDSFSPVPWVDLSTAGSWQDVARQWKELVGEPGSVGPELRAEIERIAAHAESDEARVAEAVRFVQDSIRYTGLELGIGKFKPTRPNEVFVRRFGDCKDKSFLLSAMLRELGIESKLAACNTLTRGRTLDSLPSLVAFNHVILAIELGDELLWVDPTESMVRGPLRQSMPSDLGVALLMDPETPGLTALPVARLDGPDTLIERTIVARDFGASATLDIVTTRRGREANGLRWDLLELGAAEHESHLLELCLDEFPTARLRRPIEIEDDEETGVLVVREAYSMPDFWRETRTGHETLLWHGDVDECLERLVLLGDDREAPVALIPGRLVVTTDLEVPPNWHIEGDSFELVRDAFRFEFRETFAEDTLRLRFEYETHLEEVSPADLIDVDDYVAKVEEARELLTYGLALEDDGLASAQPGEPGEPGANGADTTGSERARRATKAPRSSAQTVRIVATVATVGILVFTIGTWVLLRRARRTRWAAARLDR